MVQRDRCGSHRQWFVLIGAGSRRAGDRRVRSACGWSRACRRGRRSRSSADVPARQQPVPASSWASSPASASPSPATSPRRARAARRTSLPRARLVAQRPGAISAIKRHDRWWVSRATLNVDGQTFRYPPGDPVSRLMRTAELDYELPPSLIAQHPARPARQRAAAGRRTSGAPIRHRRFADLPSELWHDDLVVLNDTRVLPVRLRRGGRPAARPRCCCWSRSPTAAGRRWCGRTGGCATASGWRRRRARVEIAERLGEGAGARPRWRADVPLEQALRAGGRDAAAALHHRAAGRPGRLPDGLRPATRARRRRPPPACTSPRSCWSALRGAHEVVAVTLDVGLDTFRPVAEDDLDEHAIHTEPYRVPDAGGRRDPRRAAPAAAGWSPSARPRCGCWRRCSARTRAAGGPHRPDDHARLPRSGRWARC